MKYILVADDEPNVRRLTRIHLERAGYEVNEAKDGGEAWKLLQVQPFDLFVCDTMMPELDGEKLLRLMQNQEKTAQIPVVMMCNKTPDARLAPLIGAEYQGIHVQAPFVPITKPFNPAQLIDIIRRILGQ